MLPKLLKRVMSWIHHELKRENAYLLPLRIFIGTGWIRASLEKAGTPGWIDGPPLLGFLNGHLNSGSVVFPFYRNLMTDVFVPGAATMSWIVMIGQMLVGLAILFGVLTNFALLWGIFMNLNFILAGEISPSAFYIVIQTVLLVANAGFTFGFDRYLSTRFPISFLTAQPGDIRRYWKFEKVCFFLAALASIVIGLLSVPYIRDFGPHSVSDPAMLMLVLSVVTGMTAYITGSRIQSGRSYNRPQS
jgi:thiosulfate dehydrogenase (quinone) large subunit